MSEPRPVAVIVLAAGEGTRMKSQVPKVLHPLCGRSMLGHALATAMELRPSRLVVVAGHGREQVTDEARGISPGVTVVVQERLGGTGHAVRMVTEALGQLTGTVLVMYADMPLLRPRTLADLLRRHETGNDAVTVLTANVADPHGYGRIIRDASGQLTGIVEEADATGAQRQITEINSGCYAFDGPLLSDAIKRIATDNAQGQEYLTDVVTILRADGHRVGTLIAENAEEIAGVNDRVQLARARRTLNDRLLEHWMRAGVTIVDPATTWLDVDVQLGQDAQILPSTYLEGATTIGAGAQIGPECRLTDTTVAEEASVTYTVARSAQIGRRATVGPYAYLRPGTQVGEEAHIGTHVELKNATVGTGSKVPHLSYVGDATIGEGANIGAATVFVNYDGVAKHRTTIGDHVRIGSDTMLVAPLTIGDGAYTAAGSVISEDVPPGALGVARGRQHNSEGWVERKRPGTPAAEAAAKARAKEKEQGK